MKQGDKSLYYELMVFLTAHLSADVLSAILTSVSFVSQRVGVYIECIKLYITIQLYDAVTDSSTFSFIHVFQIITIIYYSRYRSYNKA